MVADGDRDPVEVTVGETVREGEGVGEGETEPVLVGDEEGVVDPLTVAVAEGVKVGLAVADTKSPVTITLSRRNTPPAAGEPQSLPQ